MIIWSCLFDTICTQDVEGDDWICDSLTRSYWLAMCMSLQFDCWYSLYLTELIRIRPVRKIRLKRLVGAVQDRSVNAGELVTLRSSNGFGASLGFEYHDHP